MTFRFFHKRLWRWWTLHCSGS